MIGNTCPARPCSVTWRRRPQPAQTRHARARYRDPILPPEHLGDTQPDVVLSPARSTTPRSRTCPTSSASPPSSTSSETGADSSAPGPAASKPPPALGTLLASDERASARRRDGAERMREGAVVAYYDGLPAARAPPGPKVP